MASQTAAGRVQRDLKEVLRLTFESSPPIYVAVEDSVTCITALIIGPPSTPYHGAFLLFRLAVQADYPNTPPTVKLLTCDSGRVRLNPNLYADGKVCLSILGTWRGETTETWRSSYSLNYVLQAIQCMVLTDEPYFNEPGFEKGSSRTEPEPVVTGYTDKIFHESMRLGVLEVLECLMELPIASPVPTLAPTAAAATASASPAASTPAKPQDPQTSPTSEQQQLQQMPSTPSSPSGSTPIAEKALWPNDVPPPPATDTPVGGNSPTSASPPTIFSPLGQPAAAAAAAAAASSPATALSPPPPPPPTTTSGSSAAAAATPGGFITFPGHRHSLAQSLHPFRHVIKRHFLTYYADYRRLLQDDRYQSRNHRDFVVALFECGNNAARGTLRFDLLVARLDRIHLALQEEDALWRRKGEELTTRRSYLSLMLVEEAQTIQTELGRVSGGPVDPNNAFVWRVTLIPGDSDLFADSMYTVELTFHPDLKEPPRARFLQPICHPNISPDGVPLYFLKENDVPQDKRFRPTAVVRQILDLLSAPPNSSPTSWVNDAAAAECFSRDAERVRKFRRTCRQLNERTLE